MTPARTNNQQLESVVDAVLAASRVLVAVAARSLAELEQDVSIPQFRSLVVLGSRGPQRPVDLAFALGVDPSSVTRLCDRLARRGLITRRRHGHDRREVQLALSQKGIELLSRVTERRREEIERVLKGVPAAARSELVRSFEVFSSAAGELLTTDRVWDL